METFSEHYESMAAAIAKHLPGADMALVDRAVDYARNLGCDAVTLNVWYGNDNAMHFYEKMGLRPRHIMMETPLEETYAD